jgi:CRP-like cAMP-binding protein
MAEEDIVAALAASEMFGGLPPKRLRDIARAGREIGFPAGTELMFEGDAAGRFFLILSGEAEVSTRGRVRATLGVGGAVGETALLDGGPRSATVRAVTDVETFSLAHWNFRPFLQETDVLQSVITLLCRRLRQSQADTAQ